MFFVGVFLVIFALVSFFWIEKRVFNRTTAYGVQGFDSYAALWKARIIESLAKILVAVSFILGIVVMIVSQTR